MAFEVFSKARLLGLYSAMRICIHFNEKDDDSLVFLHATKAYKNPKDIKQKKPNKISQFFFKMSTSYFKLVTFMDYFYGSVLGETLGAGGAGQPCLVHPLGSRPDPQRHQHLPSP